MLFKSENTRRKVTLVAGLLFFVGMSQSVIASFMTSTSIPENTAEAIDQAPAEQIDLEGGYQIVLEREPNNQTALQGLVNVRMAKEDWQGMIAPLDRLIELNPQEASYISRRQFAEEQLASEVSAATEKQTESKTATP